MRIEQLKYLLAVSQCGSLNLASEQLHISYQALNAALKALEKECDTALLERTATGTRTTTAGRELCRICIPYLDQLEHFFSDVRTAKSLSGSLVIGSTRLALNILLAEIIPRFMYEYPQVRLNNYELYSTEDIISHFLLHKIDIAFMQYHSSPTEQTPNFSLPEGVQFIPFRTIKLGLIAAKNSPLAQKRALSLNDLQQVRIVINLAEQAADLSPTTREIVNFFACKEHIFEENQRIIENMILANYACGASTFNTDGSPCYPTFNGSTQILLTDSPEFTIGYLKHSDPAFLSHAAQYFVHYLSLR